MISKAKNRSALTVIEMLVVIGIMISIMLIASLSLQEIKRRTRDVMRVSDVKQMQAALEKYYKDFGVYPLELISGQPLFGPNNKIYLSVVPSNPMPVDGDCKGLNNYSYTAINHQSDYSLYYCLGRKIAMAGPGTCVAMPLDLCQTVDPDPCGGQKGIEYDGQMYQTVAIGRQCWLKQNLNVGVMLPGYTIVPDDREPALSEYPSTIQKWCYDNNEDNCRRDGGLYTWSEAMALPVTCNISDAGVCASEFFGGQGWLGYRRGICPSGWHIPSDCEWQTMLRQVDPTVDPASPNINCLSGGQSDEIKGQNYGWVDQQGVGKLIDHDGLALSFAGRLDVSRSYSGQGTYGSYWSSSHYNSYMAWRRSIIKDSSKLGRDEADKRNAGLSVRCVKD